ncbi:hypothetical protein PJI17_10045 [Mycobacterium kansasii]
MARQPAADAEPAAGQRRRRPRSRSLGANRLPRPPVRASQVEHAYLALTHCTGSWNRGGNLPVLSELGR